MTYEGREFPSWKRMGRHISSWNSLNSETEWPIQSVQYSIVKLDPRLMWRVKDKAAKVGWVGARLWVFTIVISLKKWESPPFCVYMCVEWTVLRIPVPETIIIKIGHVCSLFISFFFFPCWSYFRGNPRYCIISLLQTSVCVCKKYRHLLCCYTY